jgi:RNA polymerase sigma-70 factor (ECF subfamily)
VRTIISSNPATTDGALVRQIAEGDLQALGVLFERHGQDVRRFLARMQVPASDLDDLVQLTFLDVARPAARFEDDREVKPWLFGLAAITVRRHRRTLARLARNLTAWALEPSHGHDPTPVEMLVQQESVRRAERALQKLSSKKREVFVLVVMEDLSGEETAHALGIPVATVWTRLHHARRELRALLGEDHQ